MDGPVEGALRRGRHLGAVHRLRRAASSSAPTTSSATTTRRASTSRSTSRRSSARATAATARRAARPAPAPAPASGRGSRRSRSTSSGGPASPRSSSGHHQGHHPGQGQRRDGPQDGPGRRARLGHAHLVPREGVHRRRPRQLPRGRQGHRGRRSPAWPRTKEQVLEAAGCRYTYSANTMAYGEAIAGGAEKIALVGMGCQSLVAAGDVRPQGGQGRPQVRPEHRAAVLQDVRRRHLRGALRGQVRPEEGRTW